MKPLSTTQKRNLMVRFIIPAYGKMKHELQTLGEPVPAFDAWRHSEVEKACGKLGLTCAGNDDYSAIAARFLHLQGQDAAAFRWAIRSGTENRRHAQFKLLETLRDGGLTLRYAERISKNVFRRNTGDLAEKEIWWLLGKLKRRVSARRRNAIAAPIKQTAT